MVFIWTMYFVFHILSEMSNLLISYTANVILDMSDQFSGTSSAGYLASPKFPSLYPLPVSAHCKLSSDGGQVRIQLVHLQLYQDSSCNNWLRLDHGGRRTTYCRPGSGTFTGPTIDISYHTNGVRSNSGVWLYFDGEWKYQVCNKYNITT